MTTHHTTQVKDPKSTKAVVATVGALIITLLQYIMSGEANFEDEGLTGIVGLATAIGVYVVSNWPNREAS